MENANAQPVFQAALGRRRAFPTQRAADLYEIGYSAFKRGEQPPADVGPESSGWFDAEGEYLDRQDAMREAAAERALA